MKQTAGNMGVDLFLIDTGDLHDGTGFSDATTVDGEQSMPVFDEIDYDLLTIGRAYYIVTCIESSADITKGNHELYESEVAYQMFNEYAGKWGDKYVTSNVKVYNDTSKEY